MFARGREALQIFLPLLEIRLGEARSLSLNRFASGVAVCTFVEW